MTLSLAQMKEDMRSSTILNQVTMVIIFGIGLGLFILNYVSVVKNFGANGAWVEENDAKPISGWLW